MALYQGARCDGCAKDVDMESAEATEWYTLSRLVSRRLVTMGSVEQSTVRVACSVECLVDLAAQHA